MWFTDLELWDTACLPLPSSISYFIPSHHNACVMLLNHITFHYRYHSPLQAVRPLITVAYVRVLHKLLDKLGYCSHQCFCRRLYMWQSRCRLNPLEEPLHVLSGLPLSGLTPQKVSFLEMSSSHLLASSWAKYSHPVKCGVGSVLLFPCPPQHSLLIKSHRRALGEKEYKSSLAPWRDRGGEGVHING